MVMRDQEGQSIHDQMVSDVYEKWKRGNFKEIMADLPGESKPARIGKHIPDIWGVTYPGEEVIVEVETCDSIESGHTKEQWAAFAIYAKQMGATFTVVVPVECSDKATELCAQLDIRPDILEVNI